MAEYYTALVCLNGHIATSAMEFGSESHTNFCTECGAGTISKCPNCNMKIRGMYQGGFGHSIEDPASFCYKCGKPYPWTESQIASANEIIDELEELFDDERERLKSSLSDLTTDTPKTDLAALRTKKVLTRVKEGTRTVLTGVLINLCTEIALKKIGIKD